MQTARSIRVGLKVQFCFPELNDSARAFETAVFFSRPKDSSIGSLTVKPVSGSWGLGLREHKRLSSSC